VRRLGSFGKAQVQSKTIWVVPFSRFYLSAARPGLQASPRAVMKSLKE